MAPADAESPSIALPAFVAERLARLRGRSARVGIIGLGYVGLPLSLLFADAGFQVTGFDIDEQKVAQLQAGTSYILRIQAEEIEQAQRAGFVATAEFDRIADATAGRTS